MNMITRILVILTLFTGMLAIAAPASAQFRGLDSGRAAAQTQRERVEASIIVYEGDVVAGREANVGVLLEVQKGWKIQAGVGSGDEVPPYIATEILLTLPDGWDASTVRWPAAKEFEMGIGDYRETLAGYDGRIIAVVPVAIPADAGLGEHTIEAEIKYQACDDTSCDIPTSITVRGKVVVADASDAVPATHNEQVARLFEETLSREQPVADETDTQPQTTDAQAADAEPAAAPAGGGGATFFTFSVPHLEGVTGLLLFGVLSALGGFILNLTPCVLPVIPIKIMTLQQHAKHRGKSLMLGLWMFAGVVGFWMALGLPVVIFAGVFDPTMLISIWWVTTGIGAIIALMGVGIMGLFTIQLPQSVYMVNPKADTAGGSFMFGVMTAVLGLPCFGFVAGALLAGAATLPPLTIMIIFTSLGIGMGFPYLVLSASPSLVEKVPHTGPASELVKQVMGLLLFAAAAFFIGTGLIALVGERPYLGSQLHWWAVALFAVLASGWLVVRTFQISTNAGPRVSFAVIGLVIGGAATWWAADSTSRAHTNWLVQQEADQSERGYLARFWNQYTPEVFANAREDGKVVVLDFTAEWCVNCKVLKAAVLDRDPVRSELNSDDVVKFTVDLTARSAPGWPFLVEELGQTGIPLLVIYTPGNDEPWQANSYTSQQVIAALEQAHNGRRELLARN